MSEPLSFEVLNSGDRSLDDFSLIGAELCSPSSSPNASLEQQEEVQQKLVDLLQNNQAMKEALQVNNSMMREQLSIISSWHASMKASMERQQASLHDANLQLASLQNENQMLSLRIQDMEKTGEASPMDDFEIVQRKDHEELISLKSMLEKTEAELNLAIADHKIEMSKVKEKTNQLELKLTKSEQQQQLLNKQLEEEKNYHSETMKSLSNVQKDYERVTVLLQIQSKDQQQQNEQTSADASLLLQKHQEEVDDLTAHLLDLQLRLVEKEENNLSLTTELETLRTEAEQIPLLKAKVAEYKYELESIHNSPDASSTENGATATPEHASSRHRGKTSRFTSRKKGTDVNEDIYKCPICNYGFTDLQACENHVNNCLDNPN